MPFHSTFQTLKPDINFILSMKKEIRKCVNKYWHSHIPGAENMNTDSKHI